MVSLLGSGLGEFWSYLRLGGVVLGVLYDVINNPTTLLKGDNTSDDAFSAFHGHVGVICSDRANITLCDLLEISIELG